MAFTRRTFSRTFAAAALAGAAAQPRAEAQQSGIFRHGVASGDPLLNRVILWTRVTLAADEDLVPVEWTIAEDPAMRRVRQRGITSTSAAFDYTVKVDVARLDPGTTYYYQFTAKGALSPIGRTKTLPIGATARLRFAVCSCSNYPYGFFNAYRLIAGRADLDFVTHLGDYIYEYSNAQYGDGAAIGRVPSPDKEIITLADYRQRYAQYRTDPDLQEAHRQHPWIVVWDDHESANDAWEAGAENHTAAEGDWSTRRASATQAWFEWLPVRENPFLGGQIYRTFPFGNLMDFIMLDTRLAGRSQQLRSNDPALLDPSRSLLGPDQEAWFLQELASSRNRGTRWRFVGQQVMMGQLFNPDGTPLNTDQWDGYPVSRARLLGQLAANQIGNVVVLTGDIHSSWANEITGNPFTPAGYTAQAVEFVTPAVTSPGIDDRAQATGLQQQIGATHPHVKYVELFRRGYLLIDLTAERAQAEFYHVRTITERNREEELGRVLFTSSGESRLRPGDASTAPTAPMLAP